jgi:DNA processing protein
MTKATKKSQKMLHAEAPVHAARRARYAPPRDIDEYRLADIMEYCGRKIGPTQRSLFSGTDDREMRLFLSGDVSLLKHKCVSVIGARNVTEGGARRARKISAQLATHGVVVTSGLAKGVDINAHTGSLDNRGRTIAVIGTPLEKCYPAEHAEVQEEIYSHHLLVSQFPPGTRTFPSDFPKRNRLMAALTDASIIVEASDSSGTLHQAAECVRLGRWLFIMQSVAMDPDLDWPSKFLKEEKVVVLASLDDVLARIGA